MNESKFIIYLKIIINFIIFISIFLVLLLIVPRLLRFFMPFVIGWIVAMIANPLVHFLEKRVKIVRKHSSAIIIVTVIGLIVGAAYLIISVLIRESIQLINDLPIIVKQVGVQFTEAMQYIQRVSGSLPANIQTMLDKLVFGVGNYVNEFVDNLEPPTMSTAGNFARNIAEVFLKVIITILSAYFFIASRDEMAAGLKKHLPASVINYWNLIFQNFKSAFGGYFKAQFKIMLLLTVIMFVGFEVLQVGYSFVIAIGIAFLDLLPVFGTGAILWPWALIDMVTGNYVRAIGLVVIYLICQLLKQLLQPKMVGDSIGLHPLATLIFMFIGYQSYGVFGLIIGIPIGMVLVNLYRVGVFDRLIRGFKIIAHDINEFRKF